MNNSFLPADFEELTPKGEIADRLIRSLLHLDLIPRRRLVADLRDPGRSWSYGADFAGRWIEVMSVASRVPLLRPYAIDPRGAVDALISFQGPDGMLGNKEDSTAWACAGRGLMGLVEAYGACGYEPALAAARRLAVHFERVFPEEPTQRACMGLRDLVRYAAIAEDDAGLVTAVGMYERSPELGPDAPFGAIFGNLHIFINVHRGLVALSSATGNREYLDQALALQRWISEEKEWYSGGVPEWLDRPRRDDPRYAGNEDVLFFEAAKPLSLVRDETCTTGDWMLLNLEAGCAIGDAALIERAEWILWNHFLSGQAADGGWTGHGDCTGMTGEVWDFCCSHHGPRCLLEALRYAIVDSAGGLRINLYLPLERSFRTSDGEGAASLEFDPSGHGCELTLCRGTSGKFPIVFRQPRWAGPPQVAAPGKSISSDGMGSDIVVFGKWSEGDSISLSMKPIVVLNASEPRRKGIVRIRRGVLALAGVGASPVPASVTVEVAARQTSQGEGRSVRVHLGREFSRLVGLYWVDPALTWWREPGRGYCISLHLDGELAAGNPAAPAQGYGGTRVIGLDVSGADNLEILVTTTDGNLPISGAQFSSLRLFDPAGNTVPLPIDLCADREYSCDGLSWRINESEARKRLEAAGRNPCSWPIPAGDVFLLPFKDVPRVPVAETVIGERGAIHSFDFNLNLQGSSGE